MVTLAFGDSVSVRVRVRNAGVRVLRFGERMITFSDHKNYDRVRVRVGEDGVLSACARSGYVVAVDTAP